MTFPEWWQKHGQILFSDHIALRADPYKAAEKVWNAAQSVVTATVQGRGVEVRTLVPTVNENGALVWVYPVPVVASGPAGEITGKFTVEELNSAYYVNEEEKFTGEPLVDGGQLGGTVTV